MDESEKEKYAGEFGILSSFILLFTRLIETVDHPVFELTNHNHNSPKVILITSPNSPRASFYSSVTKLFITG